MLPSRVKNLVSAFWVGAMQEVDSLPTLFWKGHDLQWQVPRHHYHEELEKHRGTTGHRRIPSSTPTAKVAEATEMAGLLLYVH